MYTVYKVCICNTCSCNPIPSTTRGRPCLYWCLSLSFRASKPPKIMNLWLMMPFILSQFSPEDWFVTIYLNSRIKHRQTITVKYIQKVLKPIGVAPNIILCYTWGLYNSCSDPRGFGLFRGNPLCGVKGQRAFFPVNVKCILNSYRSDRCSFLKTVMWEQTSCEGRCWGEWKLHLQTVEFMLRTFGRSGISLHI